MLRVLKLTLNMNKSQKEEKINQISDLHEFLKPFVTESLCILHGDIFI